MRLAIRALALVLTLASPASAHAFLERADPAAGSRVASTPAVLTLRFNERLEPAYSRARVIDARGRRVDHDDSRVDGADRTLLRLSVPALSPGTYRVFWRVLAIDRHVTEGDYPFTVGP